MEVSPVILLILLSALGGTIAYFGDLLGRNLGTKRLRIMGLRPRHTAILFTVLMGVLIPIITGFALISVSEPVKEWIVRGPVLIRQVKELGDQRTNLQSQVTEQTARLLEQKTTVSRLESERNHLEASTNLARQQAKQAESAKKNAEARVVKLRAEAATLTKNIQKMTAENESLTQRNKQLQNQNSDYGRQTIVLTQQIAQQETENDRLTKLGADLQRQLDNLGRDKRSLDSELFDLKTQRVQLNTELDTVRSQLRDAQAMFGKLMAGLESVRESELILRKSEELARMIIPPGLSPATVRDRIRQLEKNANTAALERGVKPDSAGRAAAIMDRQRRNPDGTLTNITAENLIDSFVNAISKSREEVVIAAVSFYNYFEDDSGVRPVPLDLGLAFNRLIFSKGDVIATASVDGTMSEEDLAKFITGFLNSQVRDGALRAGLLPVYGRNQGIAPVTVSQVSSLISKIRQMGGTVIIDALASQNTKAADMLVLEFRVRKA